MAPAATCASCELETSVEDRYGSGKCKLCSQWNNLKSNAKKEKHKLELTLASFKVLYGRSSGRRCYYCSIDEAAFIKLSIKNPRGHVTEALGLDRVDSSLGYVESNVVLCCLVCNRIKSNIFSHKEMLEIGKALQSAWIQRGLLAG